MPQAAPGAAGSRLGAFTEMTPDEARKLLGGYATGSLSEFSCSSGDCTVDCLPDAVTVSVSSYQFARFQRFLGLPPVVIPDFRMSLPIESLGCDPEQGVCLP